MCEQLQVPRSSFYAWRARAGTVTATQARREELKVKITQEFTRQRGTAGCRRIAAALNASGTACSVGLVADLMRELGLAAIQPRAWRRTTVPSQGAAVFEDLLGGDFASAEPGGHLVGDITYLRTGQGWVYLAVVLDLATRMVIGWQMADHMRTSLVIDALAMARTHGHAAKKAIFHSDHGSQGGFKWSSQHLEHGGVRWVVEGSRCRRLRRERGGSGQRTVHFGRRCGPLGDWSRRGRCSVSSGG